MDDNPYESPRSNVSDVGCARDWAGIAIGFLVGSAVVSISWPMIARVLDALLFAIGLL